MALNGTSGNGSTDKLPPHNFEAEQALLGAILVNNAAYDHVAGLLRPEHFADAVHGRIFDACTKLIERGQIANPVTLKGIFDRDAELESIGGAQYLARLAGSSVTIINAPDYAKAVYDAWMRRELMGVARDLDEAASEDFTLLAVKHLEDAESRLVDLLQSGSMGTARPIIKGIETAMAKIQHAISSPSRVSGLRTNLADLDSWLGGFHGGELIILAGRPSMGKSTLAVNICVSAAGDDTAAAMFSLEMPEDQVGMVALAKATGISVNRQRRGDVDPEGHRALQEAAGEFMGLPFHIDDRSGVTLLDIRAQARYLKRRHDIGLVCVDHLQLIRSEQRRGWNRTQEIGEITAGLKGLAKDLDVPVLLVSQLSRQTEGRDNKRPQLGDLRESGAIEQDADVVLFVYREHYYLTRKEPSQSRANEYADWQADVQALEKVCEIIVAKQRHGPCGTIKLFNDQNKSAFGNYVNQDEGFR